MRIRPTATMEGNQQQKLSRALIILLLLINKVSASHIKDRRLDEQADDAAVAATDDGNASFEYDLSGYSVHFEKCQYVKSYDDELAQDADATSPLALKHFVVYRLCPTDNCNSCDADGVVYGKYAVEVETYLESMVQYQRNALETTCDACEQKCNNNGDDDSQMSSYCTSCTTTCNWYDSLADNGYVDASEYTECQALQVANNGDDAVAAADDQGNSAEALYIGPRCTAKGKIVIGLFSDEKCREPVDNQDIEDVLGAKLSYHLLNNTYSDEGACVSCKEADNVNDDVAQQDDKQDGDDVNEMCENLYNSAAKCESKTGLTVGFIQTNRQDEDGKDENQVQNEFLACTFIDSLIWNSYDERGEIITKKKQDVIIRKVTQNQKISLAMVTLLFGALLGAAYYMDRKIKTIESGNPLVFRGEHKLT
ncbi:hypothetical protein MPSEU_000490700 [Mayamaea pseudoterrestris]|nr:hypothetical protein MPSEU_000490700 [Mayamaea pseudoterrestris]